MPKDPSPAAQRAWRERLEASERSGAIALVRKRANTEIWEMLDWSDFGIRFAFARRWHSSIQRGFGSGKCDSPERSNRTGRTVEFA
jgi:hypothetical protein